MHISKLFAVTILFMLPCFCANAQKEGLDKEQWIKTNFYYKQDAVDFITTAYKEFTPLIKKGKTESGIYKRTVKLTDCELIITTYTRVQESAWKSDHDYEKNVVIIELDKVMLEGNDIKANSSENAKWALFSGSSYERSKVLPSYSILAAIVNKDDIKFGKLHYEEHLRWAYEFLITKCK